LSFADPTGSHRSLEIFDQSDVVVLQNPFHILWWHLSDKMQR
jgi:hypothetical protein